MHNATRHRHIAQRFLVSIIQQYGKEAPAVVREWADGLEAWGAEFEREVELSVGRSPRERNRSGFPPIENDL